MKHLLKTLAPRLKNYTFWTTLLLGLVPLLAQAVGIPLPIEFPDIVNYVLALLVMLGLLNNPSSGKGLQDTEQIEIKKDDENRL